VIVIFGATGDLSRRKLLPGLLRLFQAGLMPPEFRIVGISLEQIDDDGFRAFAEPACREYARHAFSEEDWREFSRRLSYVPHSAAPDGLSAAVEAAEAELGEGTRLLHYLSIPPTAAADVLQMLAAAGLTERARVIMEKPFGTDHLSARKLNHLVHQVLREDQVFRIDHFLGKEAAQNILALRFANGLFEPIWNRDHIDHIQIDVPETLAVGSRAAFYETTGAYRDMVVTHLMQILAFVAMEPPTALAPEPITEEKNKVFRSLRPLDPTQVVRGQYEGYTSEPGVDPDSSTETFVALRCEVDNWRWSGVPFYLRTGKRMGEGARIISIAFREPPQSMFPEHSRVGRYGPDHLTFDLDESSRVSLLLRQATGNGDGPRQGEHAVLARRNRLPRRHPRGLRAADPRRDGRRPHPVHDGEGHRAPLGGLDAPARASAAGQTVSGRFLGPDRSRCPDRPPQLAPALRPALARGACTRRITGAPKHLQSRHTGPVTVAGGEIGQSVPLSAALCSGVGQDEVRRDCR